MNRLCLFGSLTAALCAASTALAQDECASAPTLVSGVASAFNTATATASPEAVSGALCAGTYLNWVATQKDVWFKWTATTTGTIDITTCDAASYDTSIVLYEGTCGSLVEVACNGDSDGGNSSCQQYYSEILGFSVTPGSTYFVRVGGYGGNPTPDGATGTGNLLLTFTQGSANCGSAGACNEVHATPGCDDVTCCNIVCNLFPSCCDTGWDQLCVDIAIPECGFYSCTPVGPANNCATNPTNVPGDGTYAFNTTGATMDGPDHSGDTCASGSDTFFNDVWWKFVAPANGIASFSTCGTVGYDNKLAVYNLGANPVGFDYNDLASVLVACNDDGASGTCFLTDGVNNYASALSATVAQGNTYLVRMGSFIDGETGAGSITIDLPSACSLDVNNKTEGEACGSNSNGGCNDLAGGAPTEFISLGDTFKGTFNTTIDAATGNVVRDLDWYRLNLTSDQTLTVNLRSESFAFASLVGGECGNTLTLATTAAGCPESFSLCVKAGAYYLVVAPDFDDGSLACGQGSRNEYSLKVTGAPASCPSTLDTSCSAPGPDNRQLSVSAAPTGNFVQGCATGCLNGAGGSTDNSFATIITGANLLKEISCFNFGVAALRSQTPTGGACGYVASNLLIPVVLSVYRDTNGGNPTNFVSSGSANGDLELIQSWDVLVPGGIYMANFEPDEPLCVENETNLVFVMDTPNLNTGTVAGVPTGTGYRCGAGVTAGAYPSNMFLRYTVCTGTAQNVFQPIGANAYEWPVIVNGAAAACSGSNCPGDFNADGVRDGADLGALLAGWGTAGGDVNGDGVTDGADLGALLAVFGTACP
jgi:hypothetical protein